MIKVLENYLDTDVFKILQDYAFKTDSWQEDIQPLWNKRNIHADKVIFEKNNDLSKSFCELNKKFEKDIINIFEPKAKIYAELMSFARTFEQIDQVPHSDSTGNQGEDNGTSHRSFSCLLYLNDNFDGGELWFPNQNFLFKPKANTAVFFPSTFEYSHGVKSLNKGIRYTITTFWTYDYNYANAQKNINEWEKNGN
jgi:hypothetical protein